MKVNINHCQLFFEAHGSKLEITKSTVREKPTLIFLHGGPGVADHMLYVSFWSRFSDIAQVIFIDQRGNGRSDLGDPSTWNLAQWGDDIYEFCKTLGINKPIVAGVSWGGHVLCSYATRHPEQPGGLIFCDTEARFDMLRILEGFERKAGKQARTAAEAYFQNPSPENVEAYQKICVPYYARNPYSQEEMNRSISHPEIAQYYSQHELRQFNFVNELKNIQCPSLILAGENAPLHVPSSLEEIAKAIPNQFSNYHLIKNVGTPVYRDAEREVEKIIREFIGQNFIMY